MTSEQPGAPQPGASARPSEPGRPGDLPAAQPVGRPPEWSQEAFEAAFAHGEVTIGRFNLAVFGIDAASDVIDDHPEITQPGRSNLALDDFVTPLVRIVDQEILPGQIGFAPGGSVERKVRPTALVVHQHDLGFGHTQLR